MKRKKKKRKANNQQAKAMISQKVIIDPALG